MNTDDARPTLTACIIARDEERAIAACLESVSFCDETVVVDSGSRDATPELSVAAGARVIRQSWLGFAAQRNVALDHARGRWVLEVDADERVTEQLAAEIRQFVESPSAGIHLGAVPRRDILVGHRLGPAAKFPVYQHRLLDRGVYRHDETMLVHEGVVPLGPVHAFEGELLHDLADSWTQFAVDTVRYARLDAAQLPGRPSLRARVRGAVLRPGAKLLWRSLVDGGWRDGAAGFGMILRDCVYDALVWTLPSATGGTGPREPSVGTGHYGARRWPRGAPHVVAVAYGPAIGDALSWSSAARAAGLDVTLLSDTPAPDAMPQRALGSGGPLSLMRALAAEESVRTIEVVVPFGRRARWLVRAVPGSRYGILAPPSRTPDVDGLRDAVARARHGDAA